MTKHNLLVWALAVCSAASAQTPLRFARQPAVSPDGSQVVFVWRDDLWLAPAQGGDARPLTTHPADDIRPAWSPDGKWLAFSSNRAGNYDVWVMPAGGGEPRRLTYHSGPDVVYGFTPDSRRVVFGSKRNGPALGPAREPFTVPLEGGTPQRLTRGEGLTGTLSPDGRHYAFVRNGPTGTRRGYRGPMAEDIWVLTLAGESWRRFTTFPGVDTSPQWVSNDQLLFVSDRDGLNSLYLQGLEAAAPQRLTQQSEPVYGPSVSANGKVVVYECDHDLWRLDLPTGTPHKLVLNGPADRSEPAELWLTRRDGASEYAVAPSGKEVAFVVRGDVYVTRYPEGGLTTRLTDTPCEESGLTWSNDSRTLWFQSDRDGEFHLYAATSADPAEPRLRRTTRLVAERRGAGSERERSPLISPDGKKLAFVRGRGDLVVANLDEKGQRKDEQVIVPGWSLPDLAWSPDSAWLAFARADENENADVFVVKATGGTPTNVSQHPGQDWGPTWSGDGSKLGWQTRRWGDQTDVCFAWLRAADAERTDADRRNDEDDEADKPKPPPKPGDKPAAPDKPADKSPGAKPVEIDLDGIAERLVRVTATVTDEGDVQASPDGEEFAFTAVSDGLRDLYVSKWSGGAPRRVTTGVSPGAVSWSPDGRKLRMLRAGGQLATVLAGGGVPQPTPFEAEIRHAVAEERSYLLRCAWRIMRDEYYNPAMNGADWEAVGRKYAALAAQAPSQADFDALVNEMLGELNSSHVGYSRTTPAQPGVPAGDLGVIWSDDRDGTGLKVESVLVESPAARAVSRLQPGDRLTAVAGKPLTSTTSVDELLLGKTDQRVELAVTGPDGKARTVSMRPTASGGPQLYRTWLKARQAEVARLSDGKVGYIHIQSMGDASLEAFERDLFAAGHGKQALLLDVRWNGGGHTADELLGMLNVRPHAWTVSRGGPKGFPNSRLLAPCWSGPVALLCNQYSFSNAEILSHAFNTLGLGPTVGWPTGGGVISTGATTLLDGSTLRLPGRGWYRATDGMNLEGHPAEPAVVVDYGPADEVAGRDPQLEAGVKAALTAKPR